LDVHNRIRGLRPWPTAYTFLDGRRIVLHRGRLSRYEAAGARPGTCVRADAGAITVACGEGAIDVIQLQPEGRRVMDARDFVAGYGRLPGRRFGGYAGTGA